MINKPQARSRLQKKFDKKEVISEKNDIKRSRVTTPPRIYIPFRKYFNHLPALIFAIPFYWITYYILTSIFPAQIKNFLLINTYLPLQIPLFIANFFFFSFLTLKTRRGFLISLFISFILFLKLQNVVLDWRVILIIMGGFVGVEIMGKFIHA